MTLGGYRAVLKRLKQRAEKHGASTNRILSRWIEKELKSFLCTKFLTYLERYHVFQRALDVGIEIRPEVGSLPRFVPMRTAETACLELRSIRSAVQVTDLVSELAEPAELARVLGTHSALDVARGGALANILAAELGHNVSEHADASSAWLCTRLVPEEKIQRLTGRDPALAGFRRQSAGFLEITVCDDGNGLVSKLQSVLDEDNRESVIRKCKVDPHPPIRASR
jgi:hypothetical protein